MADSKTIKWVDDYKEDSPKPANADNADAPEQLAANDADGWKQYRRWISKAPAPRGRRAGVDPSLYTWKGYRNWTEQVKRDWSDDSGGESD
jgi:hypothetical protein